MDINDLKHNYRKVLKATVETTKKTLEAIDVDNIAKHIDEGKKKFEKKLGTVQADLEELLKKATPESQQPHTEDNTNYQPDIFERPVDDLDISSSVKEALINAGINTVNEIHVLRDEDLLDIKGIDKEALVAIKKSIA